MEDWVVGPIMDKIINASSDYLQDQYGWQSGMREELERLRENHPKIEAVVSAYTRAQITDPNPALNNWIWRLRDAIDDADDVLDELEYMKLQEETCQKVHSSMTLLKKVGQRALMMDSNLRTLVAVVEKLDKVSAEVSTFFPLIRWIWQRGDAIDEADDVLGNFYTELDEQQQEQISRNTEKTKRASGGGIKFALATGSVSAGGNTVNWVRCSGDEPTCHVDLEIQTSDAGLHQRNNSDLIVNIHFPSSSPNDINQNLVRKALEIKKDKWKNSEMPKLAKDYFENSERTSDLLTVLKTSLEKIGDAVKSFYPDVEDQPPEVSWKMRYAKTLDELSRFKAIGDPFTDEFYIAFQSVNKQHLSMLEKLSNQEVEQEKNLKSVKIRRKVSRRIFISVFAALLISYFVLALKASPRVAAAMAVVTSIPLGSMGKWFDSMWKNYQDALKAEKKLINKMHAETTAVHTDLISIKVLEDNIKSLFDDAEFVFEDEDAMRRCIENMRQKIVVFKKSIEELVQRADQCSRDVRRARTVVFKLIDKLHK